MTEIRDGWARALVTAMGVAVEAALAVGIMMAATGIVIDALGIAEPTVAEAAEKGPTHDSLGVTWTYDGEAIRWYVFTDPDTGVQYLVNDMGGCVRRDAE